MTALANARVDVMTALVSFERVFEVLDLPPMITERPDARALPDGPIGVRLRDVRFTYPRADQVSLASLEEVAVLDQRGGEEVLHGIDLRGRRPGGCSRSSGPPVRASRRSRRSSRGSTTSTAGAVELGGIDVRDLTFAAVRGAVGVVTQDGHLFHDTIAANLRYAAPDATDAELIHALHRARLGELLATLPDGLDTVVGERGYRLSGGERQRLTIARLLLARPRVVILDEATAHLDSESEVAVQEALVEALDGRTAIVIAHRLSTIRAADEIAVVEHGRGRRARHPRRACSRRAAATPRSTARSLPTSSVSSAGRLRPRLPGCPQHPGRTSSSTSSSASRSTRRRVR